MRCKSKRDSLLLSRKRPWLTKAKKLTGMFLSNGRNEKYMIDILKNVIQNLK